MRFLNSWLEIVTTVRLNGHLHEICASAVAHHDRTRQELLVYRDTFARRADEYGPDEYVYPEWLPDPGVVRTVCTAEEAERLAGQHFTEWSKHVQSRVPGAGRAVALRTEGTEDLWHCTGSD